MAAPQASSRLEMLQARFQQKQLQEKEQKLLQLYDQQQQRAYQVVQRGSAGSNGSNHGSFVSQHTVTRTSSTSQTTSTSHGGKVRQMFDERRQTTVKGIDRSYPLEPLENKPRKQTNSNGAAAQKNGNLTVNRQSVTVKRVARADVNSNLNGGKPVVSYNEEITRESYGTPTHRQDDEDDFGNENHVTHYGNGNYREDDQHEQVRIEEIIDQDTIERNRMMAKLHLMEFDETMKHRVRNDLESEEFPEELMVDVPDRLPKRTATKKLSQAEARLERFKNVNAKRNNALKNMTPTTFATKKRSEPMYPSKSTSRECEVSRMGMRGRVEKRSDAREKNSRVSEVHKISRSFGETSNFSDSKRDVSSRRNKNPQFFCRETETSATTVKIEPEIIGVSSLVPKKSTKHSSESPEFLSTTLRLSGSRTPSPRCSKHSIEGENSKMSCTVQKIQLKNSQTSLPENIKESKYEKNVPQFFCKETEKSATTMKIVPGITGTSLTESIKSIEKRSKSPEVGLTTSRPNTSRASCPRTSKSPQTQGDHSKISIGSLQLRAKTSQTPSPEYTKDARRQKNSPQFFCKETEKSATTVKIEPEITKTFSPDSIKNIRRLSESPEFLSTTSKTKVSRVSSPDFRKDSTAQFKEPGLSGTTNINTRFPRTSSSVDNEDGKFSQTLFCKETKKSGTTMLTGKRSDKTLSLPADKISKNKSERSRISCDKIDKSNASNIKETKFMKKLPEKSIKSVKDRRSENSSFFCKESEKSATTMTVDTVQTRAKSPESTYIFTERRSESPRFSHKESETYNTSWSNKSRSSGRTSQESIEYLKEDRKEISKYTLTEPKEVKTIKSIDTRSIDTSSPEYIKNIKSRDSSPEFFCKESEKSATTVSLKPILRGASLSEFPKKLIKDEDIITSIKTKEKSFGFKSPKGIKELIGTRRSSRESETRVTQGNVNEKLNKFQLPKTTEKMSKRHDNRLKVTSGTYEKRSAPDTFQYRNTKSPEYTKKLDKKCSSPQLFGVESEKCASTITVKPETITKSGTEKKKSIESTSGRNLEPRFFCKESEKSATTFSLKPNRHKDSTNLRSKSPGSYQQKITKELAVKPNKNSTLTRSPARKPSKIEPNVLRSTSLIRDVINYRTKDQNSHFVKSSEKYDGKGTAVYTTKAESSEKLSGDKITKNENDFNANDEVEVFDKNLLINRRPASPSNISCNRVTPNLSPKSFTSTEVDTEIQEIIMPDQYVERESKKNVKPGKKDLQTTAGNTYSKSHKGETENQEKSKNLFTYSVCKPSKKRGSLLESNVFESINNIKNGRRRKSLNESESCTGEKHTKGPKIDGVGLTQIIRNKSNRERCYSSSSPSPTNESISRTLKYRTKESIVWQKKKTSYCRKVTSNISHIKGREILNVNEKMLDKSRKGISRSPIETSTRQDVVKNYSQTGTDQILKSMELVQQAMKKQESKKEQQLEECFSRKIINGENKITSISENENKSQVKRINEQCTKEKLVTKDVRNVENGIDEVDKSAKSILDSSNKKSILKTTQKKLGAKDILPVKTYRKYEKINVEIRSAKSSLSANKSVERHNVKPAERLKIRSGLTSDKTTNRSQSATKLFSSGSKDSNHESGFGIKTHSTLMSDIENTGMYDEKTHKIVKKQEAVYSTSDDERKITEARERNFLDKKGEEQLKKDYDRTDSVESALRRFDSIGTESEHQEVIKTFSTGSSIEFSPRSTSSLKKENTSDAFQRDVMLVKKTGFSKGTKETKKLPTNGKTISLKALDQRKNGDTKRKVGNLFSKSILNKSSTVTAKSRDVKSATLRTIVTPRTQKFAKARDSMETARISGRFKTPSCKRRLFQDADSTDETIAGKSKSKCFLGDIIKTTKCSSSPKQGSKTGRQKLYSGEVNSVSSKLTTGQTGTKNPTEVSNKVMSNMIVSMEVDDDSDRSSSVKQLRSIEDIRKSIESVSSSHAELSVSRPVTAESTSKSAIANKSLTLQRMLNTKTQSPLDVNDRFKTTETVCSTKRSENIFSKTRSLEDSKNLYSKRTTRSCRIAKSPSPDRGVGKVTKTSTRARGSIPSSPSKSPDTMARRPSTELKSQDIKFSRRSPATKVTESIGSRKPATTRKSTDVVDGTVLENGLHLRDQVLETKYDNDSSTAKKAEAFVIDLDERSTKENDVTFSKKPLLKKQSSEKLSSLTQSARPPSSISSVSSGSSTQGHLSGSKGRTMSTRARTPISGASPAKGSASVKGSTGMNATDNLVACKVCGRRFAQERVILHEQICAKSVQKKRKQFDTMMYRVRGTDLEPFVKKGIAKKQNESKPKKPEVKSNWRRKHEDFINAIRSAKQVQAHLAAGGKLSDLPPPPASDTSDYIQCPHCGRKFNQTAAERHIPKCEHMLHNKPVHSRAPKPKR